MDHHMRRAKQKNIDDALSFIASHDPDAATWLYRMAGRMLRNLRDRKHRVQHLRPRRDRARGWRRRRAEGC